MAKIDGTKEKQKIIQPIYKHTSWRHSPRSVSVWQLIWTGRTRLQVMCGQQVIITHVSFITSKRIMLRIRLNKLEYIEIGTQLLKNPVNVNVNINPASGQRWTQTRDLLIVSALTTCPHRLWLCCFCFDILQNKSCQFCLSWIWKLLGEKELLLLVTTKCKLCIYLQGSQHKQMV